jgi:mRNA-degrading endonuclease YafQ of YafQ-DinJ toxin-antitoxin module
VKLLATPRFLKSLVPARREEVLAAMKAAGAAYGQPHLHSGLGLRRIQPFMECRCGLDLRLVFQREGQALVFHFCGTHDEVSAFLKNQK